MHAPERAPQRAGTAEAPRVSLRPALPTLADLWPSLDGPARLAALRSVGELLRRIHALRLDGYGPLDGSGGRPLQWLLAEELGVRAFPAMATACPPAVGIVEGLLETIPEVVARVVGPPHLTHNALHPGNLLCLNMVGGPQVVGVSDPGLPAGWPAESELAQLELVLREWAGAGESGFAELLDGYGRDPDPILLAFFRALHLVRRLIAAGPAAGEGVQMEWVEAASNAMELVHGAYEQRVRAAAATAGLPPREAAALLPRGASRQRA